MDDNNPHIQTLRQAGKRLTTARLCVLRALEAQRRHITSSELLTAVAEQDSRIGRASVFRALELFTRLGIVRPTYIGGQMTASYVLMAGGHRHHVICKGCNSVHDFDDCGLGALTSALQEQLNIRIDGHLLEFYGICASCREGAT